MSPGGESDFDPLPVALAELVGHDGAITDEECCESAPGSRGSEFEGDAEEPCDGEEDDPVNKAFTPQDEACHAGALEGFGEDEAEGSKGQARASATFQTTSLFIDNSLIRTFCFRIILTT